MDEFPWQDYASEIHVLLLGNALEIGSSDNPGRVDSPGSRASGPRGEPARRYVTAQLQEVGLFFHQYRLEPTLK
jgi:hypothetical protein